MWYTFLHAVYPWHRQFCFISLSWFSSFYTLASVMIVVCRLMPVASHDTQHFNIYKKMFFVPFYWMHYLKSSQCCFISSSIHTTNYQCKSLHVNANRLFLLHFFLFFCKRGYAYVLSYNRWHGKPQIFFNLLLPCWYLCTNFIYMYIKIYNETKSFTCIRYHLSHSLNICVNFLYIFTKYFTLCPRTIIFAVVRQKCN